MGLIGKLLGTGIKEAVTGITDGAAKVIDAWNGPKEIKEQALAKLEELKLNQVDAAEKRAADIEIAYLADTQNARSRETEVIKATGHFDYAMWILAACAIALLGYLLWVLTKGSIPSENREMLAEMKGTIEMIVVGIFSYYFGSSVGSRIKDMK